MEVKERVRTEALEKIKDHISVAQICLMTNNILDWPLQSESLNNQWIDNEGYIWFISFSSNENVLNSKMEVFYSNRPKAKFLSLVGIGCEVNWSEATALPGFPFSNRKQSTFSTPIRLVKFFPEEAFYWDEVVNEMVPLHLFGDDIDRTHRKMVAA